MIPAEGAHEKQRRIDNFRRDRATFNTRNVINRANDRYFDKIQGMTKSLALLIGLETNPAQALTDPGRLMPLALGASDGLAMFARIITRPEPGPSSSSSRRAWLGRDSLRVPAYSSRSTSCCLSTTSRPWSWASWCSCSTCRCRRSRT